MVWKSVIIFFRYLQTGADLNREIKPIENCHTKLTDLFTDIYKNKDNRKLVLKLYSNIQSVKKHSTHKTELKWEKECGLVISEEDWLNMCSNNHPAQVQAFGESSVGGIWLDVLKILFANIAQHYLPKINTY